MLQEENNNKGLENKFKDLQEQVDGLYSLLSNGDFVEKVNKELKELKELKEQISTKIDGLQEQIDDIFAQLPKSEM